MNDPSVSVSVGLTVSPRPYESIRVDIEFQNVNLDGSNLEQTLDSSGPIVERLFAAALARCEREIHNVKSSMYGLDGDDVFESESPGPSLPPPRPARGQWRDADKELNI